MAQRGSAAPAADAKKRTPALPPNTGTQQNTARSTLDNHALFRALRRAALKGNATTVLERFCSCRGLLLRCPAETREHRRSPDSVRKGWSQIQAYSEPEYRTAGRLWSSALPATPRPLAARFLPLSPVEEAVGSGCRVVLSALLARLDNAPRDDAPAAHYPRMRQKQSQQETRATVRIS